MKSLLKRLLRRYNVYVHKGPFIPFGIRQIRNLFYYEKVYQRVANLNGSIVECGVGKGRSFLFFSYFAHQEGKGKHVWGFDSFEGFPEPTENDVSPRNPKKGEWSGFSPTDMREILRGAGFSAEWIKEYIHLIKGFFDKTLDSYTGGPIALLHIDSDLYESYKDPLEVLFPQVVAGGLVIFDEYNRPNWPGAKKAVDEYFKDTDYVIEHDSEYDKYFVVKK